MTRTPAPVADEDLDTAAGLSAPLLEQSFTAISNVMKVRHDTAKVVFEPNDEP